MIHVNNDTGEIGQCRARQGNCPYGGETGLENHYETASDARQAVEKNMSKKFGIVNTIVSKKSNLKQAQESLNNMKQEYERVKTYNGPAFHPDEEDHHHNVMLLQNDIKSQETKIARMQSIKTTAKTSSPTEQTVTKEKQNTVSTPVQKQQEIDNAQKSLQTLRNQYNYEQQRNVDPFDEDEYTELHDNLNHIEQKIDEQEKKITSLSQSLQQQIKKDEDFIQTSKNTGNEQTKRERQQAFQRIKEYALSNPKGWSKGQKSVSKFIKRDVRPEYIDSIDTKHITGQGAGSKFTDSRIEKAEDVMVLALAQRGNLQGDDRDKLIAAGASKNAFLPPESGVRYLQVKVDGTEAIKDTSTMKDTDMLTVTAKGRNDGKPPSLSIASEVSQQPKTNYATVIIGPDMDENKKPIPNTEVLWTMHPGIPTRGIRSDDLREKGLTDGSRISVGELRKQFGRDIKVNTKIV